MQQKQIPVSHRKSFTMRCVPDPWRAVSGNFSPQDVLSAISVLCKCWLSGQQSNVIGLNFEVFGRLRGVK